MSPADTLAEQFRLVYATVAGNLEGMSARHSLVQPAGGANCANWILGHLVSVQNGAAELAGAEPVWDDPRLRRAGFEPITSARDAIDWDEMVDRLMDSEDRLVTAVSRLREEQLAEEVPDPFGGTTSRGRLLAVIAFHQAYHAGQLALARRAAGLAGAIRGPGQPEAAEIRS